MCVRKQQIINLTIEYVKRYGYDSFSYKDLSSDIGITKATLHHHYSRKEDLGLAVCEQLHKNLLLFIDDINQIEDPSSRIQYIGDHFRKDIDADNICAISSLQAEINVIPESIKKQLAIMSALEIEAVSSILTKGLTTKDFDFKGDPYDMAVYIVTSLKGAIQYSRVLGCNMLDMVLRQMFLQLKISK